MGVLDRLLGKPQGAETEGAAETTVLLARLTAEVATLEASQQKATTELESEKAKSASLQTKCDAAMSALRAAATRMAVRAYGAEGAQLEMAKTTIEASEDPGVIGKLMEACEKAVPASLATADGGDKSKQPETASEKERVEKYAKIREEGLKANQARGQRGGN